MVGLEPEKRAQGRVGEEQRRLQKVAEGLPCKGEGEAVWLQNMVEKVELLLLPKK